MKRKKIQTKTKNDSNTRQRANPEQIGCTPSQRNLSDANNESIKRGKKCMDPMNIGGIMTGLNISLDNKGIDSESSELIKSNRKDFDEHASSSLNKDNLIYSSVVDCETKMDIREDRNVNKQAGNRQSFSSQKIHW